MPIYDGWMRTVLRPWVEETLLSKQALERGYFQPEYVRNLVAQHMAGANHARKSGVLLTLGLWHRLFLSGMAGIRLEKSWTNSYIRLYEGVGIKV